MQDFQDERALINANVLVTVARGPVPRDVNCLKQDLQDEQDFQDERALINANVLVTVARGPVSLRTFDLNEKRPQPGGHGRLLLSLAQGEGQALALRFAARCPLSYRSAGACPPQSLFV